VSKTSFTIACESAELAVECAHACGALALDADPRVSPDPIADACAALAGGARAAVVVQSPPPAAALVRLAAAARAAQLPCAVALVAPSAGGGTTTSLAGDLGLVAVDEVRPLAAVLALLATEARRPWTASVKGLPAADRARLALALSKGDRGGGRIVRVNDGMLGYSHGATDACVPVGEPRDLALALTALCAAEADDAPPLAAPAEASRDAVLAVIFGPPRALSDPASKTALRSYGLPLPLEELCTSPSRAASEATRIGYPVRIALASPDLRVWDQPDLAVDGVDNAARVRDVYRQLMTAAATRAPEGRLLGVTVTATAAAQALLRVDAEPLPGGLVGVRVGFADAHGLASGDETLTVLPASPVRIERVLERLRGSALIFAGGASVRRAAIASIADVLIRAAAFVDAHRAEVERVRLQPLALLFGGSVEVREACVVVGDAFQRSLDAPFDAR
jgi:hypothetical protein